MLLKKYKKSQYIMRWNTDFYPFAHNCIRLKPFYVYIYTSIHRNDGLTYNLCSYNIMDRCRYIFKRKGPKQGTVCNKRCRNRYCYKHMWNYCPKYMGFKNET